MIPLLHFVVPALGVLLVLLTALPFIRTSAGWIRTFDFPRQQIAIAVAFVLPALLAIGSGPWAWLLAALLAVSLAVQALRIRPFTRLAQRTVMAPPVGEAGGTVSLLIANVFQDNRDSGPILREIRRHRPDLVLLLETDSWWRDQVAPALVADYPHRLECPQDNTYGLLLYSRLPLADDDLRYLVERDVPSVRVLVTLASGETVTFFGVHPRPPHPGSSSAERDAELILVAREARACDGPAIVAGDLNDVAWSDTTTLFSRISGLLDPRVGRGLYPTFNAHWWFLRWPLDHVFVSRHFALARLERLPHVGSDHFPILVELALSRAAERLQPAPRPDAADLRDGQDAVEEGLEAART